MSIKLRFCISLNSDYHISAGHGLGTTIDSALLRESDGTPILRGTTLSGLLRDGLWRLMQLEPMQEHNPISCCASGLTEDKSPTYCGQFEPEQELCPVCRLMGTPRQPKHWYISTARPLNLKTIGATEWKVGRTGTQVVQRSRVNPRTRRTESGQLFSQEEGNAELTFVFTISTQLDGDGILDEAALWTASARMVRQLGSSRRRGAGECIFKLDKVEYSGTDNQSQAILLNRFSTTWLAGNVKKLSPSTETPKQVIKTDDNSPCSFRLIIRTDEPVILSKRAEAGNQFETLPVITGQTLRGALGGLAASRFNIDDPNSVAGVQFRQLFSRGLVSFPTLYPAKVVNGKECIPTIPAPLNWLSCKTAPGMPASGHGMHVGLKELPESCSNSKCDAPLKPLDGFIALSSNVINWQDENFKITPKQRVEMHIRLDPQTGRAVEGDLFGYVALEAGQHFVGELKTVSESAWLCLKELTELEEKKPITIWLGKATRRGYGQVTMWLEPIIDADAHLTLIPQSLADRVKDTDNIVLTLLSDTIFTDTWGRYMDGFTNKWLSKALGMSVKIDEYSVSVRSKIIDGFSGYLGLPRWRDIALQAGSAVRLKIINPPEDWQERLKQIEYAGIGLRCNEGFGCVAFNHPVYNQEEEIAYKSFNLPTAMRVNVDNKEHDLIEGEYIKKEWSKTLDKNSTLTGKDDHLTAIARWLHANANMPPGELNSELDKLGEPDDKLKNAIRKDKEKDEEKDEEKDDEYGDRDKKNKVKKETGAAIELVKKLLAKLDKYDEKFWPTGIKMLAELLAGSVKKEEPKKEEQGEN